jgi:hypothetical protein
VRKIIAADCDSLLLVVDAQVPFWQPQLVQTVQRLQAKLVEELDFPDLRLFVFDKRSKVLLKAVRRVPGSLVYDRKRPHRAQSSSAMQP